MKKYLFLFLACFATFFSMAQSGSTKPSTYVTKEVDILKNSELKLNETQLSRITSVLIGEEQRMARIQSLFSGNKIELEKNLAELKKHKIQNIKGAMTDLQKEKFDELKLDQKF
jgi:hypothetical protein